MSTTVLITGANRGIGKGLLSAYISRPDTTVIAAVRDPSASTAKDLEKLPSAKGSRVILVKIDSSDTSDPAAAVKQLSSHGIDHLDIVIANAGIAKYYAPLAKTDLSEVQEHFAVNAIGPLALFQAVVPLLDKSASAAKFVTISTPVASIGDQEKIPMPATAYGVSKVALNFLSKKIHLEHENLIAFPMSPGWVQTDMGNFGATSLGMKEAPVAIQDSIDGMMKIIDEATREKTGGKFMSFDNEAWSW